MHEESLRLVIITAAAVTLFINKEGREKYNTSREGEDEEKERKELAEKERKGIRKGKRSGKPSRKRGNTSNEVEKASTHFTHGIFVIFTSGFVSS
jgi:hypothetical protein